ncbi:MAG TPA: hypothetical protein VGO61_19075 [Steroidobacteraceae bacterium]|nr:hypothetical protein [Steroidobacteraceae bacterium]
MNKLFFILLALGVSLCASARTYTIPVAQDLPPPNSADPYYYQFFGLAAAIDGGSIIALADHEGGRAALLYLRGADGRWRYRRTLLDVTAPPAQLRAGLAMKNGIAIIKLNQVATIWESVSNDWVQGHTASPILDPGGFAISGNSILVGSTGCEADAFIYQKSATDGSWGVTGRIERNAGVCSDKEIPVDLNYDYAMIRAPGNMVRTYRKNGTQLDWAPAAAFGMPATILSQGPLAFQKTVAVSPGSGYFRRTNGNWSYQGQLVPIDYGNGTGNAAQVKYRDGVVLTTEGYSEDHAYSKVYAYVENAAGGFDHAAILDVPGWTEDVDVSGNTVVTGAEDLGGNRYLSVYTLPSPVVAPAALANNFEGRDVSGFQQTAGNGFALAGNSANYFYRQSSTTGEANAVLTDSDWRNYQSIEADITPRAFDGADRYVGLAVRYVDVGNNYYVTWRSSNVLQLKRKINGAFVTLAEKPLALALNTRHRVKLTISGSTLGVAVDGQNQISASDTTFTHGRAALLTYRARADFDNVNVTPSDAIELLYKDYTWFPWGREFTHYGGTWDVTWEDDNPFGLSQLDINASALAIVGTPTDDQLIRTHARLDSFGGSQAGAWFGLVARYVDANNYYYLSIRSSNQLQIRKVVNGAITVLESVPFTAVAREMHEFTFTARGKDLDAFVDGQLVAAASDGALPRGQYGLGAVHATATWQNVVVNEP